MPNVSPFLLGLIAAFSVLALASGWFVYVYGKKKDLPPQQDPTTPAPSQRGEPIPSDDPAHLSAQPEDRPSRSPSSS